MKDIGNESVLYSPVWKTVFLKTPYTKPLVGKSVRGFPYFTNPLLLHFLDAQRLRRITPRTFSSRVKAIHIPIKPKPKVMPSK